MRAAAREAGDGAGLIVKRIVAFDANTQLGFTSNMAAIARPSSDEEAEPLLEGERSNSGDSTRTNPLEPSVLTHPPQN